MPPKVCQYGPAANHSRVVTFLLHIFGGFQTLKQTRNVFKKTNGVRLKKEESLTQG